MSIRLLILFLSIALTACGTGGGNGGDGTTPPPSPAPRPDPVIQPEWGQLSCQKSRSCQELPLNFDRHEIEKFFSMFRPDLLRIESEEERIYRCARLLGEAWTRNLRSEGMNPSLDELFMKMVDLKTCSTREGLGKNLTEYFKETKEYKNETQILSPPGA